LHIDTAASAAVLSPRNPEGRVERK